MSPCWFACLASVRRCCAIFLAWHTNLSLAKQRNDLKSWQVRAPSRDLLSVLQIQPYLLSALSISQLATQRAANRVISAFFLGTLAPASGTTMRDCGPSPTSKV